MNFRKNNPNQKALRKGRVSIPGQIYFLTLCCENRRPFFASVELARITSSSCIDQLIWLDSQVVAWVLMPDHWHGLIRLGDATSLSTLVQRFKSITTKRIKAADKQIEKVWQSAFYDHAVRDEENIADVVRYLLNNPIRAGLVESMGDYAYWNVEWAMDGQFVI